MIALLVQGVPARSADIRVLVLPFDMHSAGDISQARRDLMETVASSLKALGAEIAGLDEVRRLVVDKGVERFDEETALSIASRVEADFAVLGSLTELSGRLSADWRVLDLKEGVLTAHYFRSAGSLRELLRKVDETMHHVYVHMKTELARRPVEKEGLIEQVTVSGNRRVDGEAILSRVSSRPGEPFSQDKVREDIKSIFGMGYFDDVAADLSDGRKGKVLTFIVREMPFIKRVEFTGNKELRDEKIRETLTIRENTVLDRVLLRENADKIKALYAEEGFFLAQVEPEVQTDGLDATVTFRIREGDEVRVRRISFIGNEVFTDDELKAVMNTKEYWVFSPLTDAGRFKDLYFQNDLLLIMKHYFDNGYVEADITDHSVLLSEDKRWFYITIAVTEGEQYTIGDVEVSGDLLTGIAELKKMLLVKPGEVFNRSRLASGINAVTDFYGDKGYANVEITPRTRLRRDKKLVDIKVEIRKNELVYFERIEITGNVKTRDKVIRRELEFKEGQLYTSTGIKRSKNNLKRLGYFEDVQIIESMGSSTHRKNVTVKVKEMPTGSISAGVGYSSIDKVIGTASISQSNFLGTGLKLNVMGTVSASSSRYMIGLTEPWLFDKPISAGFDIYNLRREYPDFSQERKGFEVRLGFPLYKLVTRGLVSYRLEEVKIFDVSPFASYFISSQQGSSTVSSVRGLVRHDTRDDAFFPTEGTVITVSTEVAGGPFGGDTNYIKYAADAVRFFPLPWDTVFSIRGSVGHLQGYGGKSAPLYERYFLGGINSLRGFQTRSVGPRDPRTNEILGGDTMLVVNVEYLFPFFSQKTMKGLVFFDTGNSYDGGIDFGDLKMSAGTGIRWFSPLGPLRLEWGFNLAPKAGEKASQWEFAVGTAF
ncbi:MAG TPA: outer membrane protein assembly factor BamA [Deltaproteobacteria bacterium]|nr:outer membrane protein assembly factor BamA [Deltaproteobacteria bacterium]